MKIEGYEAKIAQIKKWLGAGSLNVFGLPFAGKDTHCRELADTFGGVVIGGGDILRSKEVPDHVKERMHEGFLAPTEEYREIILPYFAREEFKNKPLILSSVGRWHGEETAVLEASGEANHHLMAVIHIKIPKSEIYRRWQASRKLEDRGQRHDDAEHILDTRIEEFNTKTIPVIEFYKGQGMLIEVDGTPKREDVLKEILDQLYSQATNS